MGLPFPAGPSLEKLAQRARRLIKVPVAVKGAEISFSGPESHVQRLIAAKEAAPADIARGVEHCIGESLLTLIKNMLAVHGQKPVLFVGGVMANKYIGSLLQESLGEQCAFAQTAYAGDNAVGAALFARQKFMAKEPTVGDHRSWRTTPQPGSVKMNFIKSNTCLNGRTVTAYKGLFAADPYYICR